MFHIYLNRQSSGLSPSLGNPGFVERINSVMTLLDKFLQILYRNPIDSYED